VDVDVAAMSAEAERRGLSYHFVVIDMARAQSDLERIGKLIDAGRMKLPEITIFPFDQATDALVALQKGGTRGKIVINIADVSRW
jgi:alcohol dehydrogenase